MTIRIQMMDSFAIFIDEIRKEHMVKQSKKGMALMHYLIMRHGQPVSNSNLLSALWPEEKNTNPENALKTLVSRLRVQLNQLAPDFGKCIVADRGAYHWECLPEMTIDLFELEDIFEAMPRCEGEAWMNLFERMMKLYSGDLLQSTSGYEWILSRATWLHNHYIEAVYRAIEMYKAKENYEEVINITRAALNVDNFDDRLHMEMMSALIKTNRSNEALTQYKHVIHLHYRYLNTQPSNDIQEFYKQIETAGKTLDFNLDSIREELRESGDQRGAFICEYTVFKEIFNLQMRNLERLGSTMFLAVIMVSGLNGKPMESMKQEKVMEVLTEILRTNLRKGDTITRFNTTIMALLLPTVNYSTGRMVMERIKALFYKKFPNSNMVFNYRIGPLTSDALQAELESRRSSDAKA